MKGIDPIRAWKDPVYRAALSARERAQIPAHPAGILELNDEQLRVAFGAAIVTTTAPTCTEYTYANFRRCCPK
ncbi:MAG TPA: mersacidin/lichenicidin family type 2 lantibiotic [Thermoanaerobaculia bacterium]|jgi:mersacidin/lichenicidin family type 2 lantibiotic